MSNYVNIEGFEYALCMADEFGEKNADGKAVVTTDFVRENILYGKDKNKPLKPYIPFDIIEKMLRDAVTGEGLSAEEQKGMVITCIKIKKLCQEKGLIIHVKA